MDNVVWYSTSNPILPAQSDNNVRLIILDRMEHLAQQNKKVVQEHIMDILRTVTSQNQAIREKAIDITLSLVTSKSIEDVLGFLKKEIVSAQADSDASDSGYKSSLIEVRLNHLIVFLVLSHFVCPRPSMSVPCVSLPLQRTWCCCCSTSLAPMGL